MKIAIDITQVIYETGVSVYTRELVKSMVGLFAENEYILFGGSLRRRREIQDFASRVKNAKSVVTPISPTIADILWNRLHILSIESFIGKVDIFHTSDWAEPPAECPKVTTIHDLSFLYFPKFTDARVLATHKRRLYFVKKESHAVIVPSKATKEDAVKLGISEERIKVIHEAPSKIYKKASRKEVEDVKNKYKIRGEYALAVGASPRKNITRIINAFEKSKVDSGLEKLVIAGRGEAHDRKNVLFLGHVPVQDLPALYSGASVFIYASLYEGFGLPILEAFSCECPVVTSNISSMPEIAASASLLVDPSSVESIAVGIVKSLRFKDKLVKLGKERVKDFSWSETAKKTMNVYKEVLLEHKL